MADLQQTIIGALQQAGLHDPAMLQQVTASVMSSMGMLPPSPTPGFGQPTGQPAPMGAVGQAMGRQLVPGFSGPAPAEQYGYEGQPNRDLLASQSFGRGPAPASLDPSAESDMMAALDAEQGGWQPFQPQMMPPGSPAMGPGVTAAPPSGGSLLASDALRLRKPAAPGKGKPAGKQRGALSESDRLNWQSYLASGGDPSKVPPSVRSLLSSGA